MTLGPGGRALLACALLVALAAGVEAAAYWSATSTLTTSARPPPAVFEHGANANNTRYVEGFTLSQNQTSFSGTFKGRTGAEVTVKDVVRLHSTLTAPATVTLTGSTIANAKVTQFAWTVRDGTTPVATLDHKTASPTATFTLPAGATFLLDLKDVVAKNSGKNDANVAFTVGVRVS